MSKVDIKYREMVNEITESGRQHLDPNRKKNKVHRLNIPKYDFKYNLQEGFPVLSTKQINFETIVGELLWMLKGFKDIQFLVDNNINIWNKDAYVNYCRHCDRNGFKKMSYSDFKKELKEETTINYDKPLDYELGNLEHSYGQEWTNWGNKGENQIKNIVEKAKKEPYSSDLVVTAWNPDHVEKATPKPCHKGFQIMGYKLSLEERLDCYEKRTLNEPPKNSILKMLYKRSPLEDRKYIKRILDDFKIPEYGFDLVWEQRSVDTFLGFPFNLGFYALLSHIIGLMMDMVPGNLNGDLRNVHIYSNHMDAVREQMKASQSYEECELSISSRAKEILGSDSPFKEKINSLEISDFTLNNYTPGPRIKAKMIPYDK